MFKQTFAAKPFKFVLGAALLTAGMLLAGVSGARPAAAIDDNPGGPGDPKPSPTATPVKTAYKVQLTFETIRLDNRDDGWEDVLFGGDQHLEIYGRLSAGGGGASFYRMFGTDNIQSFNGNCPDDGVRWAQTGWMSACPRGYGLFDVFGPNGASFADLPMCAYNTSTGKCSGGFSQQNNATIFMMPVGEKVNLSVDIMDHDDLTSHDQVCLAKGSFGPFTDAQFKGAGGSWQTVLTQPNNGNASCSVRVTLKRVP